MKNLKFARNVVFAAAVAASAIGGAANAEDLTKIISLNNVASNTYAGYGNTVMEVNLGSQAHINTLSWDVTLTAFQGSFINEAYIQFSDSLEHYQLYFLPSNIAHPPFGEYHSGTEHFSGSVDFRSVSIPGEDNLDLSFSLRKDGILRLEFAENDDGLPGADAIWNSGTLTVGYSVAPIPEPSTYAMMLLGLGAVGVAARRRKNRSAQ